MYTQLDAWSPTELTAVLEIIFDSLPLFEKFGLEWLEQLNQDLRLDGSHVSSEHICYFASPCSHVDKYFMKMHATSFLRQTFASYLSASLGKAVHSWRANRNCCCSR